MESVRRYRALASLCRQQAAYRPLQSWQLLGQAERFEHLAQVELEVQYRARNTTAADAGTEPAHAATTAAA
jgi:hypothetical protein